MRLSLKGHLLTVGGLPDGPVATFAVCDPDGAPYRSGQPIIIPLDSEADARQLGAMLYSDFEITIWEAAKVGPRHRHPHYVGCTVLSDRNTACSLECGHALPHEGGGEYWDDDRAPLPRPRAARGEVDP
jgi:hypothetical protein